MFGRDPVGYIATELVPAYPSAEAAAIERAVDLAHATNGNIRLIHVRSLLPVTYREFIPPHFDEQQ